VESWIWHPWRPSVGSLEILLDFGKREKETFFLFFPTVIRRLILRSKLHFL
jgi:hypothetical protein